MNDAQAKLESLRIDRRAPAPSSGRRWWWLLLIVPVLGAAGYLLFAGTGAPEVRVAPAAALPSGSAPAGSVLDASGYVTARRIATVSAKITGKVTEVMIEEGMRVETGQVLAQLDDAEARAALALAQARLASARARVGEIDAAFEQARRELTRQQELDERRLTSRQAVDIAVTEFETRKANLVAAGREVEVAERALAAAQVDLDNTTVRAPFAGVVTVKAAQPGEMISPISAGGGFTRTGIGTIVDMDSLEIEVDVNENFINRVQPGQRVSARLNAYPDWSIPAHVIAIVPTADRSKATVKVRVGIDEKDERILPDMGVRVAFLEAEPAEGAAAQAPAASGVLVPAAALLQRDGRDVVFVYADGRIEQRAVQAGETRGDDRIVRAGLRAGERVVVAPAAELNDGARVRVATQ